MSTADSEPLARGPVVPSGAPDTAAAEWPPPWSPQRPRPQRGVVVVSDLVTGVDHDAISYAPPDVRRRGRVGAVTRQPLRIAVLEAERILAAAGVASPRADAELLAAHVLDVERTRLPLVPLVDPTVIEQLGRLVARRARREPLQHLVGTAPMGAISVEVGPGVFTPRPETELLLAWAVEALRGVARPVVVDLCTGSAALALAIAAARPDATVHAVENDPGALAWARRNANARATAGDTAIVLHGDDVTDRDLLHVLDGSVDLVVCNPPYVPAGTAVPPEVADHDPPVAVFGGADGLAVVRPVVAAAARLLRPGGAVAIEHDDTHGEAVPALLRARTVLTDVTGHLDLAGRPRFATARRTAT